MREWLAVFERDVWGKFKQTSSIVNHISWASTPSSGQLSGRREELKAKLVRSFLSDVTAFAHVVHAFSKSSAKTVVIHPVLHIISDGSRTEAQTLESRFVFYNFRKHLPSVEI